MKIAMLLVTTTFLTGCVAHNQYDLYRAAAKENVWNKRNCSTHCAANDEHSSRCVEYHEIALPYCDVWRGKSGSLNHRAK